MSKYLLIGFLDGEITDTFFAYMSPTRVQEHFPIGEVYQYGEEPHGPQWRVLVRGVTYWPSMIPSKPENIPEIVRMTALMAT